MVNLSIRNESGTKIFNADNTLAVEIYREKSPVSNTLAADILTFTVTGTASAVGVDTSRYGDLWLVYKDGVLLGKFYLSDIKRSGRSYYTFTCHSAVSLMQKIDCKGDMYQGETAGNVIAYILGGTLTGETTDAYQYSGLVPFSIEKRVANGLVSGHLKYQKVSDDLLEVLHATGAGLFKDASGDLVIKYPAVGSVKQIQDASVYVGGSFGLAETATSVKVTEHAFFARNDDTVKVLFDNSDGSGGVDNKEVVFDNPMHSLSASGSLTIVTSGVNYAIVSGSGVLTGKEYTHTMRVLEHLTGAQGEEKVISISNNTLVNAANSANVARRAAAYYNGISEITCDFVHDGEAPGDYIAFTSPCGETVSGVIKSQDIIISGTDKATTVVAKDFVPEDFGDNYDAVDIVTQSGTWEPPADCDEDKPVRLVLMGGFKGGQGASDGQDGENTSQTGESHGYVYDFHQGGKSGNPGEAGVGGIGVMVNTIDLAECPAEMNVSIGVGGPGGARAVYGGTLNDGSLGEDTTVTIGSDTYSTARASGGVLNTSGVVNVITGTVYNIRGEDGVPSASKGGDTSLTFNGSQVNATAQAGGSCTFEGATWAGGSSSAGRHYGSDFESYPAGGGGAAYGVPGGSAGNNSRNYPDYGGAGASPQTPAQASLGRCGRGGHSGGGGGGGGGTYGMCWSYNSGGPGGRGSSGGQGSDGILLVYYKKKEAA